MKTLREISETALIHRLVGLVPRDHAPMAGPGDDCAVIDLGPQFQHLQLLKTDALVENVHFLPDAPARAVGWKAAARVVSDFAAMGGRPDRFLITLALPPEAAISWAEDLYRGIGDCLQAFGGLLAGGETTRVPTGSAAVISISATGSVCRDHLVLRSTAKPGDALFVTGRLGGSIHGRHLDFTPRLREAEWLVRNQKPSAMMDLSDGLAQDLPRLASASGCGFVVDEAALPLNPGCTPAQALRDGEDFEILFTLAAPQTSELVAAWPAFFPELSLTCIGRIVEVGFGDVLEGGWDHFAG